MLAGPRPARELEDLARAQGIARSTLAEARKSLGIVSERIDNQYIWHYPRQKIKR